MPNQFTVRPFQATDLNWSALQLAARHRANRRRFPILPARFEEPPACHELLQSVTSFASGFAAELEGEPAGFLFGIPNMPAPTSTSARFGPERGSMIFAHGHAAAEGVDPRLLYNTLFAAFAEHFTRFGVFDHFAHVPSGDPALDSAWMDLGFGRANAVGIRDTSPLPVTPAPREVRRATVDDLDDVCAIGEAGDAYHAGTPMFTPWLGRDTAEAGRDGMRKSLADEKQAIFLGMVNRRPAGILRLEPPKGSPLFIPDDACYIGDTAVLPGARGSGLGAALLDAALAWARAEGYRAATLHYLTANPLSSTFWTSHGFQPVMYHLRRRLDERIAWAQPTGEN